MTSGKTAQPTKFPIDPFPNRPIFDIPNRPGGKLSREARRFFGAYVMLLMENVFNSVLNVWSIGLLGNGSIGDPYVRTVFPDVYDTVT